MLLCFAYLCKHITWVSLCFAYFWSAEQHVGFCVIDFILPKLLLGEACHCSVCRRCITACYDSSDFCKKSPGLDPVVVEFEAKHIELIFPIKLSPPPHKKRMPALPSKERSSSHVADDVGGHSFCFSKGMQYENGDVDDTAPLNHTIMLVQIITSRLHRFGGKLERTVKPSTPVILQALTPQSQIINVPK